MFRGAEFLYSSFVRPVFLRNQPAIDLQVREDANDGRCGCCSMGPSCLHPPCTLVTLSAPHLASSAPHPPSLSACMAPRMSCATSSALTRWRVMAKRAQPAVVRPVAPPAACPVVWQTAEWRAAAAARRAGMASPSGSSAPVRPPTAPLVGNGGTKEGGRGGQPKPEARGAASGGRARRPIKPSGRARRQLFLMQAGNRAAVLARRALRTGYAQPPNLKGARVSPPHTLTHLTTRLPPSQAVLPARALLRARRHRYA